LALEYDGEHHRLDPYQYAYDIRRSEDLDVLGWTRLRVVKSNSSADILRRLDRAWRANLLRGREIS
jgi:very-short-patch-repair endonuclease